MERKQKRGRPPKPAQERKRNHQWFRARDELAQALERAAAENQRSVSEEVEHWLEQWAQVRRVVPHVIDGGDVALFGIYVGHILNGMREAGDESGHWRAYVERVPFFPNVDMPGAEDRIAILVRDQVEDLLEEARRDRELNGSLPADGVHAGGREQAALNWRCPSPRRAKAWKSWPAVEKQAWRRYVARFSASVLANRERRAAEAKLAELTRDPEFMARYRDRNVAGHREAVAELVKHRNTAERARAQAEHAGEPADPEEQERRIHDAGVIFGELEERARQGDAEAKRKLPEARARYSAARGEADPEGDAV